MGHEPAIDRFESVFGVGVPPAIPGASIIAIVLSYNEAMRLPHFLEHYSAMGVGHFIVVDNGSTDETAELLDTDTRVTRIYTTKPYSKNKAAWREVLADMFCTDKWTLFIDVDELLIYPGWPALDLRGYCDLLDARGEDALFTTMVDMYPDVPLSQLQYEQGTSFVEVAPYFDTGNYRLIPIPPKARKQWPTPQYRLFGGARERLFSDANDRSAGVLAGILSKVFFAIDRRNLRPAKLRRSLDAKVLNLLGEGKQKLSPANMSKVPLLRWREGTRFPGGPHRVSETYAMSDDWGALLHFKYFDDFGPRSKEAVDRGQHAAGAEHYKIYVGGLGKIEDQSLMFSGSRRFSSTEDLTSAGLMRISPATQRALEK
ncbi:MAG: glycosyltransferase family 2 protein [Roseobacter sp.]